MDVYVIEIHYTHFAITSTPICSCVPVWLKGTTCKCLYMEECSIIYTLITPKPYSVTMGINYVHCTDYNII